MVIWSSLGRAHHPPLIVSIEQRAVKGPHRIWASSWSSETFWCSTHMRQTMAASLGLRRLKSDRFRFVPTETTTSVRRAGELTVEIELSNTHSGTRATLRHHPERVI